MELNILKWWIKKRLKKYLSWATVVKFKNLIICSLLFIEYWNFNNKKFLLSLDKYYHIKMVDKIDMLGQVKKESNAWTKNELFTKRRNDH